MTHISHDPFSHDAMTHVDAPARDLLRSLELDWRRMCGNQMTPTHVGLDPLALDDALPYAFVLRRVGPGQARFRIAGQKLHEMLRMDPRGLSFGTVFTETARDTLMELVEAAYTLPAIIAVPLEAQGGFGRKPVTATVLLLPMRDAQGEITRILGAIVPSGPLPRRALRFGIAHHVAMRCDPLDGFYPDRRSGSRRPAPLPETPAPQPAATPHLAPQRAPQPAAAGRPALRLVVDNTRA